jgi:hypothetical protein
MGKRSCLALALALCLTVCAPSVRAADPAAAQTAPVSQGWLLPEKKAAPAYPDTRGAWCAGAADTVSRAGLMEGYYDGTFGPQRALTNAQSAAVCARLHSLLTGGDGNIPLLYDDAPWYAGYYAAIWTARWGATTPCGPGTPEKACRRERALPAPFTRCWTASPAAGIACRRRTPSAAVPDVDLRLRRARRAGAVPGGQ